MATLLLSAAGTALGGALGGSFLGLGAASIGQAAGAIAGGLLDQKLLGTGSRVVEQGRARSLRLQSATEGAPIPQTYGRMRVAGQIIWSTRFLEAVNTTNQGGKGGGGVTTREYSYSISIAVALCEGPIDRIGRVWADGKLMDLSGVDHRVYLGSEDQLPDPKIEAVEGAGNVPAYRGTAYLVLEDLPVGPYGNRIPQINVEVFASVHRTDDDPEAGEPLRSLVKAVAMSPGTGEFALDPQPARYVLGDGREAHANLNNPSGETDFTQGLQQLVDELPECGQVSLILSWFGDDLRAGQCSVRPKVEVAGRAHAPEPWEVAGLTTATAETVSQDAEGRPLFGGTPSDASVVRCIEAMQAKGLGVMLYPFLLMDIAPGNGLPDPYGRPEQPPFPWRGRITLDPAPGEPGSPDQTAGAAAEVAAFFGTARAQDFTVVPGEGVSYAGPDEWTWRRAVLHMAGLAAAAGGVEAFCIGSEFRALTTARSARTVYPAVAELIALAAEVRELLPGAKISYAADWSEYFGHQPNDGTGDRIFHLDPLWADANIDFVGIDDYLPLSDWRYSTDHLDRQAGAKSVYSLAYLQSNVEGGEHYDWFYASDADREAQIRSPIADTAHGEDWVFRPKDIRGWWSNPHHDRVGGVRSPTPTPWVPQSKPVWLTETGCPAVDLGSNQPNLFFDPKSSESAVPPGSVGARDDENQRRYLQAKLGYWQDPAFNPVSAQYGGRMIPEGRIYVWTWDARPYPDFPVRESVWSDGPQHRLGHWITGRVTSASLADIVWHITDRAGIDQIDVSGLFGAVDGYVIERTGTAREALQPLMLAYAFDALESAGAMRYVMRALAEIGAVDPAFLVAREGELDDLVRERASQGGDPDAVRLSFVQSESDYRVGAVEAWRPDGDLSRVNESSVPIAMPASRAQAIVERWLIEAERARERIVFTLPASGLAFEPADIVAVPGTGGQELYRIEQIRAGAERAVEAVRVDETAYIPARAPERTVEPQLPVQPGPLSVVFLDLPLADGGADHEPRIAVSATPWAGAVSVYRGAEAAGLALVSTLRTPAFLGTLVDPLPSHGSELWQRVSVEVALPTGAVSSADRVAVLNGANAIAVEAAPGAWEILQFETAELIAPGRFRLATLLRGRRGTEHLAEAEIPAGARIVVMDNGVAALPLPLEARGLPRHWRVGPASRSFDDPAYVASVETFDGVGLRPYRPAHLAAERLGSGDVAVSWVRRARIGGDSWEGVEVPLGEEREAYRLRVLVGGSIVRTVETAAPAFTYTAADQAADGATGAFEIRVAQLSVTFGYGPEKGVLVDG